jgi:hypothetical protein
MKGVRAGIGASASRSEKPRPPVVPEAGPDVAAVSGPGAGAP